MAMMRIEREETAKAYFDEGPEVNLPKGAQNNTLKLLRSPLWHICT